MKLWYLEQFDLFQKMSKEDIRSIFNALLQQK